MAGGHCKEPSSEKSIWNLGEATAAIQAWAEAQGMGEPKRPQKQKKI